jgi:hypothetical protein
MLLPCAIHAQRAPTCSRWRLDRCQTSAKAVLNEDLASCMARPERRQTPLEPAPMRMTAATAAAIPTAWNRVTRSPSRATARRIVVTG